MKQWIAFLLTLVLALSLVACGNKDGSNNGSDNQQNQIEQPDQPEDGQNNQEDKDDGQEPQLPDGEDITGTDTDSNGDKEDGDESEQTPAEKPEKPAEQGMKLSRTDFTLFSAGNTYRLTVSGVEGTSTFSSSDESVATVAKDGTVTAVAPGKATITVTNGDQKASCIVRCNWTAEEKPEEPEEPEKPTSGSVDLQAFYDDMVSTYEFQNLQNFTGDPLDSYYPGMSGISTKQCLIMGTMLTMNNGEFCLVEVSDSKDVETVKGIFQARIDYMAGGGAWYPGPTELWTNSSRVVSNGNYVMMVVHESCDDIVAAFNDYTK